MTDTTRRPAGRLNGVHTQPGTIVGPNDTGELMVVLDDDEHGVTVSWATQLDIDAAHLAPTAPRSVTEHRMRIGAG